MLIHDGNALTHHNSIISKHNIVTHLCESHPLSISLMCFEKKKKFLHDFLKWKARIIHHPFNRAIKEN